MPTIDELIEYHNECEYLDFKQQDYTANNKFNLIKDVMVLANADTTLNRHIIIGVKKVGDVVELFDVTPSYDSANIQEYIYENIEPELNITYEPFNHNGKTLLVISVISPNNTPYMIKKNVTAKGGALFLTKGDFWVRKGSRAVKGVRGDLDRMRSKELNFNEFEGKIEVEFKATKKDKIELSIPKNYLLPSLKEKQEIEALIKIKELYPEVHHNSYEALFIKEGLIIDKRNKNIDDMPLSYLIQRLSNIKVNHYTSADLNYIYEKCTHSTNFWIGNYANRFLTGVTFELRIPRMQGLLITTMEYPEPLSAHYRVTPESRIVSKDDDFYSIIDNVVEVAHNLRTTALSINLKIGVFEKLLGQTIEIDCLVHAKEMTKPIKQKLYIDVVEAI